MEHIADRPSKRGTISLWIIIGACISALVVVGLMLINTFYGYRDILVQQQQEQLLAIVRSVSTSCESYIENQQKDLRVFTESYGIQQGLARYQQQDDESLLAQEVSRFVDDFPNIRAAFSLYDAAFSPIYFYQSNNPAQHLADDFSPLILDKVDRDYVVGTYMAQGHFYLLALARPMPLADGSTGYGVAFIDLRDMYTTLIEPSKADEKGYTMVKDNNGIILMHPVSSHIGTHAIYGRQEMYPDVDFTSMSTLIVKELEGLEGVHEYSSYWFSDDAAPVEANKFSSFTPMELDEGFWVFGLNMDYEDFARPFFQYLTNTIYLFSIIFLILAGFALFMWNTQRRHRELEKETQYLRELNQTLDELHSSEEKVRHYERLKVIGTMTGGIAHEFNNLLTPIMGYAELLCTGLPDDSIHQEDAHEILLSANRAKELVAQISSLSYKETARDVFTLVNLTQQLPRWVKSASFMKPDNITVQVDTGPLDTFVFGNGTQLYQVVLNLCANAVHAMGEAGGTLRVTLSRCRGNALPKGLTTERPEEEYALIHVSDTGCGMPQDVLENIFNPFFTTKGAGEGTGLGLSMVQNIVYSHDGAIQVWSAPGEGSTFVVCLPCSAQAVQALPHPGGQSAASPAGTLGRILLVEDEPRIRKMLARGLRARRMEVDSFEKPEDALAAVKRNPGTYALLVSDFLMPGLTGTELARQVRATNPNIKILILTGLVKKEVLLCAEQGIIDSYVIKPVGAKLLAEKIQALLG